MSYCLLRLRLHVCSQCKWLWYLSLMFKELLKKYTYMHLRKNYLKKEEGKRGKRRMERMNVHGRKSREEKKTPKSYV